MKLVCEAVGLARSSFYAGKRRPSPSGGRRRRRPGPGGISDEELALAIRETLARSPFSGEGYRKVWARLRREKGIWVSRKRVLRVMREEGLLSPCRRVHTHSDGKHDGTIIPPGPNMIWGTDATRAETEEDGWVWVFVCVDHWTLGLWLEAAKVGDRFAALEPIRRAVKDRFGGLRADVARGVKLRHDHGSQYMSHYFLGEIRWLGMESSPAFVGEPEGNGMAEWVIRQLKEQVLWTRRFRNLEDLRSALLDFQDRFNREWLVERLGYRSPQEAYGNVAICREAVA